ncbi:hypothetical protein MTX37_32910, partial [Rhodococcus sp. ARC_M8]|uniref:hypothetical protein n=1 Tax=Rhodococcus sp. ARC_M8 TaxID=2928853 RepID=UPI001FB3F5E6
TAPAFSSGEYRRIVGLPDTRSFGMLPSSFPRPEVSTEPRAIQWRYPPGTRQSGCCEPVEHPGNMGDGGGPCDGTISVGGRSPR